MIQEYNNFLTAEEIDYFNNLPEVKLAKETIDLTKNGNVSFTVALTSSIKQTLENKFAINLTNITHIPMRWIKGDTIPHIDQSSDKFINTHLVYLTNSRGKLIIDDNSYSISRGSAYKFSEGVTHKTIDTGSEPRLLLGPMSEHAITVGSGIAAPGGTTINIFNIDDTIYYKFELEPESVYTMTWPCNVQNTDLDNGDLVINFTTDIIITNYTQYFICNSDKIQFGNKCLKNDGSRPIITIRDISDGYIGIIQNGSLYNNGYNNISIYNLHIHSDNSFMASGGGWLACPFFSRGLNNISSIYNCSSDGPIALGCGGIAGGYAGKDGGNLKIIGCYATGNFTDSTGGGIIGHAENVYIDRCYYTDDIFEICGGIVGFLVNPVGAITVKNCYTTGNVGFRSGGIICDMDTLTGIILVENCYSMGNIDVNAGGIYGKNAISSSSAVNCYSNGIINLDGGGGIFSTAVDASRGTVNMCYASDGNWQDSDANLSLHQTPSSTNYGGVWTKNPDTVNTPYILSQSGYSPFARCIDITDDTDNTNNIDTVVIKGNSTDYPLLSDYTHTILEINGENPSSYPYITIDPSGQITVAMSAPSRTYNLKIYSKKNPYAITNYNLIVIDSIPCLTPNTIVLTPNGYIEVSKLNKGELIITSDNREVYIRNIFMTKVAGNKKTYPYIIPKSSISKNYPPNTCYLSSGHLIKFKNGWIHPKYSKQFKQDESKDFIIYYHIELPNYNTDNLVINGGLVVESYTGNNYKYQKLRKKRVNKYLQILHLWKFKRIAFI